MAKVLKADGSSDNAYVAKAFASEQTDVYVSVDVWLTTDALAAINDHGYGPIFFALQESGSREQGFWAELIDPDPGFALIYPGDPETWAEPLVAEHWYTLEMHVAAGSPITTAVWVDGASVTFVDGTVHGQSQFSGFVLGLQDVSHPNDARQTYYLDNLKIGTTRGGTELFSEDFEGATPLADFDSTSGDVSIVDDPSTPPVVFEGIWIAFDDDTLEPSPTPTRIDDPTGYRFATAYSISRGRQSELEKTGTGTATITLIDKEGQLDPTNPTSPFAGTIDPMKQAGIMLHNPVTDTWHTIFRGFVSDWFYDIDTTGRFSTIRLELADAFDLLAALEMTPGNQGDTPPVSSRGDIFFEQTVGPTPGPFQRINQILDDAGWPADLRFTLTGNIQLQPSVYERLDQVLSVLFDTADAEFPGVGNIYVDKTGRVSFRGRYSRFDPENPDWGINFFSCGGRPQADADPDNVAPITAMSFRRSKSDIINAVTATPQIANGDWTEAELATMFVKDDASIAQFGWRGESFENLLVFSGRESPDATTFPIRAVNETKLYAQYYVDNYSQPTTRVEKITLRSRGVENSWAAPLWAILTQIDIGDVLHITTTHEGGGGFDDDYFVEGLHYEVEPKDEDNPDGFPDVTLELDLSPRALYNLSPFLLGADDAGGGSDFSVSIEGTPEEGETLTAV